MWNPAGPLLQVTFGPSAGAGAAAAQSAEQQLSALIEAARTDLQNRGIVLPETLIQSDDRLAPDSVVSYIGLERHSDQVTGLADIVALLTGRVAHIGTPPLSRTDVQALLATAVAGVAAHNYDQALSQYSRAYYHSEPNGYQAEIARSLSDAGNIYLRNGDLGTAIALLTRAVQVSHAPGSDAGSLAPQATLSLAGAQLLAGGAGDLTAGFQRAAQEAYAGRSAVLSFVALINWAHACCRGHDDLTAATVLEEAAKLVAAAPGAGTAHPAAILSHSVGQALAHLSASQHDAVSSNDHESIFADLQQSLASALTASLPAGAVCELFKVNDISSLGLFGTNYDLRDAVFNGVDSVGGGIIQNMK